MLGQTERLTRCPNIILTSDPMRIAIRVKNQESERISPEYAF